MIDLIQETEAMPASYPDVTPRLVVDFIEGQDQDPGSDQIWQRIEAYTRTRYTSRQVVWVIEGMEDGTFVPPLEPVTAMTAQQWVNGAWASVPLSDGPVGYLLPSDGIFKLTATVGGGDVPAAVAEAFKRLHEYSRGVADSFKNEAAYFQTDGSMSPRGWAAKGLQLSGAADLLRPYRRLK